MTYAEELEYDGKDTFTVRKADEDDYQIVEVDAPCLVTALASGVKPRYMSVRGIVEAYDKPVEVWNFDSVEVDPDTIGLNGSPTRVAKSFAKGMKAPGQLYEVEPEEAVEIILAKLREKFII